MSTHRGILHIHSTHSYDGKLSLPELKAFLQERDITFACMSEHTDEMTATGAAAFVAECRALSDESFVFVPGFEVPYRRAHILQFGSTNFLAQTADEACLTAWSKEAPFTVLAHPIRNNFVVDQTMAACLDGVEIWNQQYEGKQLPRTRSATLLRSLRKTNSKLLATGGIDFHRPEHFGSPVTEIEMDTLSETNILQALTAGRYAFGTDTLQIEATGDWRPTLLERLQSTLSISVIDLGKFVNKLLFSLGLSLPKSLKQKVRRLV